MRAFLIRWLVAAATLTFVAQQVEGFTVDGFKAAFLAVAVLAVGNALLQPAASLIKHLGCLLNLLTLGLFEAAVGFVFYTLAFLLTGAVELGGRPLVAGFQVDGIGPAIIGALSLTVVGGLLKPFLEKPDDHQRRRQQQQPPRQRA